MRDPIRKAVLAVIVLLFVSGSASPLLAGGTVNASEFGNLGKLDVPRGPRVTVNTAGTRGRWEEGAEAFVRSYTARRGGAGNESFRAQGMIEDDLGQVHIRLSQSIAGLPVAGAQLIVHADKLSGKVLGVNGNFAVDRGLARQPMVDARRAIEQTLAEYGIAGELVGMPALTYVVDDQDDVRLAWSHLVRYASVEGEELDLVFADAVTGAAAARHPQTARAISRQVYNCANGCVGGVLPNLPGNLMFSEGGSSADTTAMAAYNNLSPVYNYFKNVHSRNSWNGGDATIRSSVHYGTNVGNAAWNNTHQLIWYGDGDGTKYSALAFSPDVVAHEFTHGVTFSAAGIPYTGEPGAVNESISDIFAAATRAYVLGSIDSSVWRIAEDVYTPGTSGDALRYMNDPSLSTDPSTHPDYYPERDPGGLTHTNAGPMNLAFYLLVQGGQHPRGETFFFVTSIGMNAAERIFYRALTVYATNTTNYRKLRAYTLQAASDLYGSGSTQYTAVWNAWAAVGSNWLDSTVTLANQGDSYSHNSYTTNTTGIHTGQLEGPGTNYNLYLDKWNGSAWVEVAQAQTSSTNETIQSSQTAGKYRWRVNALIGSGQYKLFYNYPK